MLFQFQHQLYEGYKASQTTNLHISILSKTNFCTSHLKASPKYTGRSRKHPAATLSLKTTQNMSEESQTFLQQSNSNVSKYLKHTHPKHTNHKPTYINPSQKRLKNKNKTTQLIIASGFTIEERNRRTA